MMTLAVGPLAQSPALATWLDEGSGQAPPSLTSVMHGPCSGRAQWHLRVVRVPEADRIKATLRVASAKPGSRWDYSMVLRMGDRRARDSAVLTADSSGRWRASLLWFVKDRGTLRGTAQATSRGEQQCRIRFAQTGVPGRTVWLRSPRWSPAT